MSEHGWRPAIALLALSLLASTSVSSQAPASTVSDERTLRIIIVESVDEAQRLRVQLLNGENFVALAARVSIDATADNGGLLGRLSLSTLRPELRGALQNLTVGELTEVVPVPTGFAIVKIVPDSDAAAAPSATANRAVSAAGSVKGTFDVSGFGVAILAVDDFAKPADWNQDPRTICEVRTKAFAAAREGVERDIPSASQGRTARSAFDTVQLHFALGQIHAYDGKMDQAIDRFQKAYDLSISDVPSATLQLEEALGIAYLHRAEMDNGLFHAPGDRCLLSPRGIHTFERTADSQKAVDHFVKYLAAKPDELEVRWLLNLAYMTLGGYPDKVPASQLIPPSALASREETGRFVDVARDAGLDSFASAGGLIVDDFDNDGRLDVVTTSSQSCAPMRFFQRQANGMFADRSAQAGLQGQLGGLNTMQADYNNDGFVDILVLRGGWEFAQRKSLLRNNGNGTFTDVTVESGLARPVTSTQTAVWTDVNNDGLLDLFVGNEDTPAQLFVNQGNGTFNDIARAAGVDRAAFSKGVAAGDYDNDGWTDLYVSNLGASNFLYHNNHDGTFTELGRAAGVLGPGQGFATWFFDYDNDGRLDIFATSYFKSVDEVVRTYLQLPHNATTLKLYRNLGDGSFLDVTRQAGLDKVYMPMGSNFGDIDNDGFLDIYLGTGNPSYASVMGSVLLRNRNGASFVDVTASSGTGEIHKGHGVAFADLDNDGDEEIVFEVGGATPGDAHALRLFENRGASQDWINLKLVGVKSNRGAVDARIAVTVEHAGGIRQTMHRSVGTGGSFGASPLQQHIGLGASARIAEIEVWWPTSNTRQRFTNVAKNQTIRITEFGTGYTSLDRPVARLGAQTNEERPHVP